MPTRTGVVLPRNGDSPASSVAFSWTGAACPNVQPLTILSHWWVNYHVSYYTKFFHGRNDGGFTGANYWGCHPYPDGGAGGTTHKWEISADGADYVTDANGNSTQVEYWRWYRQASIAVNTAPNSTITHYWDLDNGVTRKEVKVSGGIQLSNDSPGPGLIWGDAYWNPQNERGPGIHRCIQIYNAVLTEAQCVALSVLQTDAEVLAAATSLGISSSLWYLNMNPTPSDISDKSGAGHNPAWLNANIGTLWTNEYNLVNGTRSRRRKSYSTKMSVGFNCCNVRNWF